MCPCKMASRIERCVVEALGLALVLLVCAGDLHGRSLNHSTYRTPHPILASCGDSAEPQHVEPAGAALTPEHAALLRSRSQAVGVVPAAHAGLLPRAVGRALPADPRSVPSSLQGRPPAPRGPPVP